MSEVQEKLRGMFHAFDPGSRVLLAELVPADAALAALTLRCSVLSYVGAKGQRYERQIRWVPLATLPDEQGMSWLLWGRAPPCYADESRVLPVHGLEAIAVQINGVVYLDERRNYLQVPTAEQLPPGAWMAS